MKTQPYSLFLDDCRNPPDAFLYGERQKLTDFSQIPAGNWDVVRSYDEFVFKIKKYGVPERVSFDNDLAPSHYKEYMKGVQSGYFEWQFAQPKMGLHALMFLLEYCDNLKKELPIIYIHTANFMARTEMENILKKRLTAAT